MKHNITVVAVGVGLGIFLAQILQAALGLLLLSVFGVFI